MGLPPFRAAARNCFLSLRKHKNPRQPEEHGVGELRRIRALQPCRETCEERALRVRIEEAQE